MDRFDPEMLLSVIKTRRSTRKFRPDDIPEEMLAKIIEAGRYAPSGGNNQKTRFLVIRDKEVLERLKAIVTRALCGVEETLDMYASFRNSVRNARKAAEAGTVSNFYYSAPVLILTASEADYYNRFPDCACALQDMMLAANSMDLGSCWINTVRFVQEDSELREFLQSLGMAEGELVCGGVALGWPDTEDGLPARDPLPRKGNPVVFI